MNTWVWDFSDSCVSGTPLKSSITACPYAEINEEINIWTLYVTTMFLISTFQEEIVGSWKGDIDGYKEIKEWWIERIWGNLTRVLR